MLALGRKLWPLARFIPDIIGPQIKE